jgi:hypothetical protein
MSVSNGPNIGLMINALTGDSFPTDFRKFLRAIDALLQGAVIDRTHAAPPGSPVNGDRYIVAASPTGAWVGHATHIAVWTTDDPTAPTGAWQFYIPKNGWLVWSVGDGGLYAFTSGAWAAVTSGGGGGAPTAIAGVNNQTASYTLVIGDAGFLVRMNVASSNNLTVPPNSSVAFPINTVISVRQIGAGVTTIVAGAGVTINSPATLGIARQNGTIQLVKVATDTWDLIGDVA